jgi:aspartate aminotransferase-like enzyme
MAPRKELKLFVFPGGIDADVLAVGGEPVPYARTDEFAATTLESERWLLELLGCTGGRLVSYTASGTAAMEAVISNFVTPADRILAIEGGTFGRRWVEMLRGYPHASLNVVSVPFGEDPDYDALERQIAGERYGFLFMQHHETSSGVRFDVARLGAACRAAGTLFAVDAISSFLADDFSMDRFGIDAAVLSSHKGLCLPPGLGFVALSSRALEVPFQKRNVYFDFAENLKSLSRGHPLFTPAVQLYLQLHKRLDTIRARGVDAVIAEVRNKADRFRNLLAAEGRPIIARTPSSCLTSFNLRCPARDLVPLLTAGRNLHHAKQRPQPGTCGAPRYKFRG